MRYITHWNDPALSWFQTIVWSELAWTLSQKKGFSLALLVALTSPSELTPTSSWVLATFEPKGGVVLGGPPPTLGGGEGLGPGLPLSGGGGGALGPLLGGGGGGGPALLGFGGVGGGGGGGEGGGGEGGGTMELSKGLIEHDSWGRRSGLPGGGFKGSTPLFATLPGGGFNSNDGLVAALAATPANWVSIIEFFLSSTNVLLDDWNPIFSSFIEFLYGLLLEEEPVSNIEVHFVKTSVLVDIYVTLTRF